MGRSGAPRTIAPQGRRGSRARLASLRRKGRRRTFAAGESVKQTDSTPDPPRLQLLRLSSALAHSPLQIGGGHVNGASDTRQPTGDPQEPAGHPAESETARADTRQSARDPAQSKEDSGESGQDPEEIAVEVRTSAPRNAFAAGSVLT